MASVEQQIAAGVPELKFNTGKAAWELVRIGPGEFLMGSPPNEPGREEGDIPPTRVRITRPYYIGRFQVTQSQYRDVTDQNPSRFHGDDLPVDQIQFVAAAEFCRRLSRLVKAEVTLPTEAQWEYACRAGTTTRYYSGNDEASLDRIAWYRANSNNTVHPVGAKQPNAWGIYDTLGNLYEPCADYILHFDKLSEPDPEGERFPSHSIARGGAWMVPAVRCRAASRTQTNDLFGGLGIRIAINT